jgi:hypothetical protein
VVGRDHAVSEPLSIASRRAAPPAPATLELTAERLLQDWKQAHRRAVAYLEALGVASEARDDIARRAVERAVEKPEWPAGATAISETLAALRELLVATSLSREGEGWGEGDQRNRIL